MPVPIRVPRAEKNIWVAASDGDLARVQELIEVGGLSPNVPDTNTYTPMHAAASYGHLHVLDYLIAHGGNVNLTDEDGDTPLYVVEDVETARYLVEHGAVLDRRNNEGQTAAEYLTEDFPEVSQYLESLSSSAASTGAPPQTPPNPSQHAQNQVSDALTSSLMQSVQDIMQRAEAEGSDPDAELREVVGRHVLEGMMTGYEMSTQAGGSSGEAEREEREDGAKRSRTDEGPS